MRLAAFNMGDFRLLDHIAPLAQLLEMPLFVEIESNFEHCRKYYPKTTVEWVPTPELELHRFVKEFDVLFECKSWGQVLKRVFLDIYQKDMMLISCSHGQSDKGYGASSLHHYGTEDGALIYGDLLHTMFQELQIPARSIFTGNYRLFYYYRNKEFYDEICEKEVFSRLSPGSTTVLYAPTWKDSDEATTFFSAIPDLLEGIPPHWNLIVKGHPLLETNNPERYYHSAAMVEKRPNTILLSDFPLIYPLLSKVDLYLGDYSSVGYDMLAFEKPMFFLVHPHLLRGRLHGCGTVLNNPLDLLREYEKGKDFTKEQRALYKWAFEVPSHIAKKGVEAPILGDLSAFQYPPVTANNLRNQVLSFFLARNE